MSSENTQFIRIRPIVSASEWAHIDNIPCDRASAISVRRLRPDWVCNTKGVLLAVVVLFLSNDNMPVVAVRSWFGGGALTALAVLTSSVCGGVVNVDSMPNDSIGRWRRRTFITIWSTLSDTLDLTDHPHLNHTVGYHCWSDRDCNVQKFERCSTYNICVCEFAYDYDRYQCKSCPNEHQPCSECCPQDTHECTESQSQCQEREWWRCVELALSN